ncbi:MAG: cryptochrome/photolyase family protein [Coriobacteriia bacterium]
MTSIVLFRNDLRLADNPALSAAVAAGPIVPVYVADPASLSGWEPGAVSARWLAASLSTLETALLGRGGWLVVRTGDTAHEVLAIARETGASAVHWNRRYEPAGVAADARVLAALDGAGLAVHAHHGSLLREPEQVRTSSGGPYQVFTPFYQASAHMAPPDPPQSAPDTIAVPPVRPAGVATTTTGTAIAPDLDASWTPGEAGAQALANAFFERHAEHYDTARDRPDTDGTSRLSPHLAFGEISPRQLWHQAAEVVRCNGECHLSSGAQAFTRQLYWREFAYHLLVAFPQTPERPLRRQFEVFPWTRDDASLDAWRHGMTGYPIVDAGMRQMLATGWMHNRVRMLVASFLTKDLLLPWLDGARWFWERLVDADLANNTLGWQWVAGCGADAAPYFRIFNPVTQGKRYDPQGEYVRRWVPELAHLPTAFVHEPWKAPTATLAEASVTLGRDYPLPIIDHAEARARALAVYGSIREVSG